MVQENEVQEEQVPSIITDEYLKDALQKIDDFIKDLRSQENYQLANQVIRLVSILENVHFQLKNEEEKVKDLEEQYVDASGRIEEAIKISQKDHDVIKKLKSEVEIAWMEADASKIREQHTNESLSVARERNLKMMDRLKKLSSNVEVTDELGEHKVTVLQQCERLNVEVEELNKRLTVQRAYSDELQKKLEEALEKNRDLFREWDTATNETLSNKKSVEKLQKQLKELTEDNDKLTESLIHFQEISDMRQKRLMHREKQVIELSEKLEKCKADNSVLNVIKSKMELSLKSYKNGIDHLKHELDSFQAYVRLKEDENRKLVIERDVEVKKVETLSRRISSIEKTMSRQDQEIVLKKSEIVTAEKERDLIKRSNDEMKRERDKLSLKIEQMTKEAERLNASISTLKQEIQKIEEEKILINNDLKSSIEREKKTSANVKKLQANIETVESEKLYLTESIKQLNEDIEFRKKQYEKIKLELNESNEQVAHFKHEYNITLKRLKDARSDFQRCHEKESDVKDRLVKYKSQIDDISDKMTAKLAEIVTLMKKIKKLEKKNRELKREFEKGQESLRMCHFQLKNVNHDNKLLKDELRENHSRFIKMKNQADKILRERDLIANQMYRKNDENSLLEEQVSMLKISIERGNSMYNERLEDINVMKNEIKSLRSQCNVLKRGLQNTTDMRHEVLQLHRKLNQERTKARVLEDEMATPMNVHRWRKLGHRDPGRMDLMRKCQRLQKNCLNQSARVVKAEELIKVFQEKIDRLEQDLEKRPGPEVSEKLLFTRTKLQENTKRMKAAIAISRASIPDLCLRDNEITKLQNEVNELKSQLFKEKRIRQQQAQKFIELNKNSEIYNDEKEVSEKLKTLGNAFKRGLLS